MVKPYEIQKEDKFYQCSCGLVYKKDGRRIDCPRCRLIESKFFEQEEVVNLYKMFTNSSKFTEIIRKTNG